MGFSQLETDGTLCLRRKGRYKAMKMGSHSAVRNSRVACGRTWVQVGEDPGKSGEARHEDPHVSG